MCLLSHWSRSFFFALHAHIWAQRFDLLWSGWFVASICICLCVACFTRFSSGCLEVIGSRVMPNAVISRFIGDGNSHSRAMINMHVYAYLCALSQYERNAKINETKQKEKTATLIKSVSDKCLSHQTQRLSKWVFHHFTSLTKTKTLWNFYNGLFFFLLLLLYSIGIRFLNVNMRSFEYPNNRKNSSAERVFGFRFLSHLKTIQEKKMTITKSSHHLHQLSDRCVCVRHLNQSNVFFLFVLTFGFILPFFMVIKFRGIGKRRRFIRKIHQWWFECAMKIIIDMHGMHKTYSA